MSFIRSGCAILVPFLLFVGAGCSRETPPSAPASRPAVAESRAAPPQTADPNAENPDRDSWVDLAARPFKKELVGGRLVQVRSLLAPSLNAVTRPANSADVERMLKFFLGVPLLMELPDLSAEGVKVVPHGATSFPEESADRLVHTWTLRPDLTWQDGVAVTAEDYAFTFRMMRLAGVTSQVAGNFSDIRSVEAVGKDRVRVTWSKAVSRGALGFGLDFQVVPAHAMPADPVAFNTTTTHQNCGPYKVARFSPDLIELSLRPEYRERPFPIRPHYVETIVYQTGSSDPAATFARLLNEEVHLAGLQPDQFATAGADASFRKVAWRTSFYLPSYSFIAWNLRDPADEKHQRPHPILGDVRVRKALSHLIPIEQIVRTALRGFARPMTGPFDPFDPGYDRSIQPYAHDSKKALALLDEAGYRPGPDGKLMRGGKPLSLSLMYHSKNPSAIVLTVSQVLQDEARKIGVGIEIEPRADFFAVVPGHRYDGAIVLWVLDAVEPDLTEQWSSKSAREEGANYTGFADEKVDALLERHRLSTDAAVRANIRREIHGILHEAVPATFLVQNASTVAISKAFANIRIHDLGIRFHDFVRRDLWEKHR